MTVATFASKFRSKTELYSFLTLDVKCYLPAPHTLTVYFLKDLVTGVKKRKSATYAHWNLQTSKWHMLSTSAALPTRTSAWSRSSHSWARRTRYGSTCLTTRSSARFLNSGSLILSPLSQANHSLTGSASASMSATLLSSRTETLASKWIQR